METITYFFVLLVACFPPWIAFAWSEGGHHLIAAIAFSLLTDQERAELLAALKNHPRFAEDFVPPKKLANDDERTRSLVGCAGYWPDVARKHPKYHRSTWHYDSGLRSCWVNPTQSQFLSAPDRYHWVLPCKPKICTFRRPLSYAERFSRTYRNPLATE